MFATIDNHIIDSDNRSETGSASSSTNNKSSGFDKSKYNKKKEAKKATVDLNGRTPEEVHEIRYAGIRYDMYVEIGDEGFESSMGTEKKLAMTHYRLANDQAAKALSVYKIMMAADVRDKLMKLEGRFDDLGTDVFGVMHTMKAFLGPRPDHAPAEITVVRLRLACGVENNGTYHTFPSPLPIPFGKSAEYTAGEKEYHEIDIGHFEHFNEDFISIFYNILTTLDPSSTRRSMSRPRFPLVVCKPHFVQHSVMSFEYLHQRALLAQAAGLKTSTPADFIVPTDVPIVFCDLRSLDSALRSVLREFRLVTSPISSEIDHSKINHCYYHMGKNKLNCTTYSVCELVEHCFIFSKFFGCMAPRRFVDPFDIDCHIAPLSENETPDSLRPISEMHFEDHENVLRGKANTKPVPSQTDDAVSECDSESGDIASLHFKAQVSQRRKRFTPTVLVEQGHDSSQPETASSEVLTLSSGNAGSGFFNRRRTAKQVVLPSAAFSVSDSFRSGAFEPTSSSEPVSASTNNNPTPSPTAFAEIDRIFPSEIVSFGRDNSSVFYSGKNTTTTTINSPDPQGITKHISVGRGLLRRQQ